MALRRITPREGRSRRRPLDIDARVVVRLPDGERVGGWISARHRTVYRVVTDGHRRVSVGRARLTRGRENVLMLEARLDKTLRSYRHQGTFLREFLKPFDVDVLYERVHTKDDLARFLSVARRDPNIPYIHYVGHGDFQGQAKLRLTFQNVDLRKDAKMFADLGGKVLIFSCCLVGADRSAMRQLLKASGARAIVAYDREIDDAYAFVAEALLYSRIFDTRWRVKRMVRRVRAALQSLELRWDTSRRETRSPLLCFSP